ncbi:hypothetical protein FA95DRAFT_1552492 [Auriscalpium vulgare]|uniref:Uncharacterized protein n=1 Tax=Auriscalpium vulgare TaxID=40419 RepID=A0ACB8SBT5_9AGAM|nr:hypothetical protein FA95DRAFT_1552492 [Auriscalpium vulgare]
MSAPLSNSLSPQLAPFEIDPRTGEPYLRLPPPLSHIVITPPRPSDAPTAVRLFNDPLVYRWVSTPPFPYLLEHAEDWYALVKAETGKVWKELQEASADGPLKIVAGCPVRAIRCWKEDGTDVFIGDCGFMRHTFADVADLDERTRLVAENKARPPGDPNIIWSIGDYLDPAWHGKGIMTAVIGTLMSQWAIPRMAVRVVRPSVFDGNIGSVRTFEKNGFTLVQTLPESMFVKEKGPFPAENRTQHFLEWRAY